MAPTRREAATRGSEQSHSRNPHVAILDRDQAQTRHGSLGLKLAETTTMTVPAKDLKAAYLRTLVLASVLLVFTTLVFRYRTEYFLRLAPLSLGEENVVAFVVFPAPSCCSQPLHASDGYFRLRNTHSKAAFAWCVVTGMLLFLAVDELPVCMSASSTAENGPPFCRSYRSPLRWWAGARGRSINCG